MIYRSNVFKRHSESLRSGLNDEEVLATDLRTIEALAEDISTRLADFDKKIESITKKALHP